MNRPQQGRVIVRLVRALTGTGLLVVVITIGLIGWTLSRVRRERDGAAVEQAALNRVADKLNRCAVESRTQLEADLDETLTPTGASAALPSLATFITWQSARAGSISRTVSEQFGPLVPQLTGLAGRGRDWRERYDRVWPDVSQQLTLSQVRTLLSQLRSGIEIVEGRRRLEDAIQYKRWRNATGEGAHVLAEAIAQHQGRGQTQNVNSFKSELAECARLVELLGGEERLDDLADIKDNKLKPVFDRLVRLATTLGAEASGDASLQPAAIDQLRAAILGAGPDAGGLFALRHDALRLRREREKLKAEIASLFQGVEKTDADFGLSTQARTTALTQRMESNLTSNWWRILSIGVASAALFLWLARVISRGIQGQVQTIDRARAEAEEGRQTTQKLMREQQAAAVELTVAHKDMQASEHRLRMILESEPECVKLVAADGSLLEINPAGLRLVEADEPEQVLGRSVYDLAAPEYQAMFRALNEAVFLGESRTAELEIIGLKGTRRWMRTHACPLRNLEGGIIAQLAVTSDITERKVQEQKAADLQRQLMDASRQAGMAEIATGVLHNVGNVLNSVNVSMEVAAKKVRQLKATSLGKVAALVQEHAGDPAAFFANPQGAKLPAFLAELAEHFIAEQAALLDELGSLKGNVEHINEIVAMQQTYAGAGGLTETLAVADVIEDALRLNAAALDRHGAQVVREFDPALPAVPLDRHKLLQILVNLIRNAKYAMDVPGAAGKQLTVRTERNGVSFKVSVSDMGIGIDRENLTRIFNHGFTTKKEGHGFGLHSGANAATEMGGRLSVHSDGLGHGATFTLTLPLPAQPA